MKIYAFPPSPNTFKVLAAANHMGIDYQLEILDLVKGEQLKPRIIALHPDHRLPILEDEGYVLWESNAILQYLAAKKPGAGLMPRSDLKAELDVTRWLFWDCAHWGIGCAVFLVEYVIKPVIGGETDPAEVARGTKIFERSAGVLDRVLAKHRFVCGDQLSIADFALAAPLIHADAARLPLANYAAVRRWYGELTALPGWQQAAGLLQKAMAA